MWSYDQCKEIDPCTFPAMLTWCSLTNRTPIIPSVGLRETSARFFLWSFYSVRLWLSVAGVVLVGAPRQRAVCDVHPPVVARLGHVGERQAAFVHLLHLFGLPALVCRYHLVPDVNIRFWAMRYLPEVCSTLHSKQLVSLRQRFHFPWGSKTFQKTIQISLPDF